MRETRADELSRNLERAARAVLDIRPLSRTEPHAFLEDKDAAFRRLMKVAADLRNTFGGPAAQFRLGDVIVTDHGRPRRVPVETRRRQPDLN